MQDLVEGWIALLSRHSGAQGIEAEIEAAGRALLACWAESHRRYHDLGHLRGVLRYVDELAPLAADADAVRLAAWYHDAVYAGRSDDEEQSARKAEAELTALSVPAALVAEVARLIRMTVTHDPAPGDANAEVLSDADLATLALPPAEYAANGEKIRFEYAHVPEREFRAGRSRVVEALLAAPALYRTPAARQRWERPARDNLTAELASLRRPPGGD